MSKREFGDWQTPIELARVVLEHVATQPASVLEPTCGTGAFLRAADARFPQAALLGYELYERHASIARSTVPRARVDVADFFTVPWEEVVRTLAEPILVTGNPPWITAASLGELGSKNLPDKVNFKKLSGHEARTGKSNFDVSEWMLLRLVEALQGRRATVAVLCKAAVARRVIEFGARWDIAPGAMWRIDAQKHFGAAVDAVLFVCELGGPTGTTWPVYPTLESTKPETTLSVVGGTLVSDAARHARTSFLAGVCEPEWRSGLKHDCARVMELERDGGRWRNGLGEPVTIERSLLFPLLKSSDVARGKAKVQRAVIVPQRALGEDTSALQRSAPKAWRYLGAHRELLAARKSSIYRGQPEFAIFGVGPYSFAPWKVAISGLYKKLAFTLVGPRRGQPVMLDDTCYFLPFDDEATARATHVALRSSLAREFFGARIFWDAKRPIQKALLQQLNLRELLAPKQQTLFD